MRERQRDRIRALMPEQFRAWLHCQPDTLQWSCTDGSCCPLHEFIEARVGESFFIGDSEIRDHWAPDDSARYSMWTPFWMSKFIWALGDFSKPVVTPTEALRDVNAWTKP